MKIVIIGSGNVATVLGRLCKKRQHEMVQVVSRNAAHAKILANELNCAYADYDEKLNESADIYIIAVADTALQEMNSRLHLGNKLTVHTAGSVSKEVLKDISHNYGVLYPLQSLRKEMQYETDIPFLIDGNTADAITLLEDFASTLSATITKATDDERLKLHVAAVMVSNFTNHLYALAEDFCKKEGVDFGLLIPLIKETAERIQQFSPADVQTGPAVRNDIFTIDKHLRILTEHPQLKYMYIKLTDSIMKG
ncbi:MAG: DUF2520 domain-containing protein [Ferruginibacter sp.]|nr:DUF2520 domain-containing protein [Ferruginibacter sp.]